MFKQLAHGQLPSADIRGIVREDCPGICRGGEFSAEMSGGIFRGICLPGNCPEENVWNSMQDAGLQVYMVNAHTHRQTEASDQLQY